jgi:CubicO group peptidase (beta-lactamase class C family)
LAALLVLGLPVPLSAQAVDRLSHDARRRWAVPGLAVTVVKLGRPAYVGAFGERAPGLPVTPDTLFPLASLTKGFTAALIARLADEGKLGWDDPVRNHLPDFRLPDPAADRLVTVRDLLTHRTGVGGHDLLWYRAPWPLADTLRRAARLPAEGRFRDGYLYNSTNFIHAGLAAAAAGGRPWDQLVRSHLTGRLGITDVAFTSAEADRFPDRAVPHDRDGRPTDTHRFPEPNPAGSVQATARGLALWLTFQLAGDPAVLSARNWLELKRPHTPMPLDDPDIGSVYPDAVQVSYALGWVVFDRRGSPVLAHGGQIDGFRAVLLLLPRQQVGVAVLCNKDRTLMPVALAYGIADLALGGPAADWDAHFQKVQADRDARPPLRAGAVPARPLAEYAGTFTDLAYGDAVVSAADGNLTFAWSSFRPVLLPAGGDCFRMGGGPLDGREVEFVVSGGRVTAVRALDRTFTRGPKPD